MTMKIFVSHSSKDRPFAERLGKDMRALGADVYLDARTIPWGANWSEMLRDALEATDTLVLLVPEPGSADSHNAFFEAGAARALGKRIVAVLPDSNPTRLKELDPSLIGLAMFDGSRLRPEALAKSIVSTLEAA